MVDMYVKVETERLNFLRHHRKSLRAETYSDIRDALMEGVQLYMTLLTL